MSLRLSESLRSIACCATANLPCSETYMAHIQSIADSCGYTNYSAIYVTFPPNGPLPLPGESTEGDRGCRLWEQIFDAALLVNPAFDIYRIFDTVSPKMSYLMKLANQVLQYPILWDVLGFPYVYLGTQYRRSMTPVPAARSCKSKSLLSTLTARTSNWPFMPLRMFLGPSAATSTSFHTATPAYLPVSRSCRTSLKRANAVLLYMVLPITS